MIVGRVHDALRAALPASVPVLPPEEIELPKAGRTPGQAGGLGGYLAAHPDGYVQIEEPVPIGSDSVVGTFWVTVAALHTTPAGALALGMAVRRALCGLPDEPGAYTEVTPAQPSRLQPGVWMYRPTYDALTLSGDTAG